MNSSPPPSSSVTAPQHARRRRSLRKAVAGAAAAGSVLVPSTTASAEHGSNLRDRDNNSQAVDKYMLSDAGIIACDQGTQELERSEISMSVGSTDIHCYDANYGNTDWVGETQCTVISYDLKCDQYSVRFNYYHWGTNPDDFERQLWKSVGCHEFGHTSSVGHRFPINDGGQLSCMRNGASSQWQTFDDHDIETIDQDG